MSSQFDDGVEDDQTIFASHITQFYKPINDLESGATCLRRSKSEPLATIKMIHL